MSRAAVRDARTGILVWMDDSKVEGWKNRPALTDSERERRATAIVEQMRELAAQARSESPTEPTASETKS